LNPALLSKLSNKVDVPKRCGNTFEIFTEFNLWNLR